MQPDHVQTHATHEAAPTKKSLAERVADLKQTLVSGDESARTGARKALIDMGFRPQHIEALIGEHRKERVLARYLDPGSVVREASVRVEHEEEDDTYRVIYNKTGLRRDERTLKDDLDRHEANRYAAHQARKLGADLRLATPVHAGSHEASNGSRQVAWYWPIMGVALREGLTEEQAAEIAVVLSNAALPRYDNALRMTRIQAAAKQVLGHEIGEALAVAFSYAHRRQQRQEVTERKNSARKVGRYGAKSLVAEAGKRKPGYKPTGHRYETDRMGNHTIRRPDGKTTYLQGDDAGHFEREMRKAKTQQHRDTVMSNYDHVAEGAGAEDKSQTIFGGDRTKPKGGAKKVGDRGALNMVREYRTVNDAGFEFGGLAEGHTQVWMAMEPSLYKNGLASLKEPVTASRLSETHVLLGTVRERDLDNIYTLLQKDKWSSRGQAKGLVEQMGVNRESLGVGDVIVGKTGAWFVDVEGFARIGA